MFAIEQLIFFDDKKYVNDSRIQITFGLCVENKSFLIRNAMAKRNEDEKEETQRERERVY